MTNTPKAGEECPECHYSPLYEDAGMVVCAGCDQKWDPSGKDADWDIPQEEEA